MCQITLPPHSGPRPFEKKCPRKAGNVRALKSFTEMLPRLDLPAAIPRKDWLAYWYNSTARYFNTFSETTIHTLHYRASKSPPSFWL